MWMMDRAPRQLPAGSWILFRWAAADSLSSPCGTDPPDQPSVSLSSKPLPPPSLPPSFTFCPPPLTSLFSLPPFLLPFSLPSLLSLLLYFLPSFSPFSFPFPLSTSFFVSLSSFSISLFLSCPDYPSFLLSMALFSRLTFILLRLGRRGHIKH